MARVTTHPILIASAIRGLSASVQTLLPDVDVLEIPLNEKGILAEEQVSRVARSVLLCDRRVVDQFITRSDLPLKWVHSSSAGMDVTMSIVREKKIQPNFLFTRTGDAFGQLMGEYVVGHVIAHERRFKDMFKGNECKQWPRDGRFLRIRPLTSLTIGILGLGQIGKEIASFCKGMGMTVWGLSRGQRSQCAHVDQTRGPADLASLLSNSDYVCSILPSTPETRGLLSGEVLASCKEKKTVLINIGRGDVVSEDNLVNALNQGWIGGAILDVFAEEPLPESSPLWSMSNVTITPHCSGPCLPSQVAEGFVENYHLFCNGDHLKFQVDWAKGY